MAKRGRKPKAKKEPVVAEAADGGPATKAGAKPEEAAAAPAAASVDKGEPAVDAEASEIPAAEIQGNTLEAKAEPVAKSEPIAKAEPVEEGGAKVEDVKAAALSHAEKVEKEDDFLPMSTQALDLLSSHPSDEAFINEYGEKCGFQPNDNRYAFEHAKSARATCKGACKEKIEKGEVRFGSSKDGVLHGSFSWRHVACITGRQLVNVARAYETEEYAVIPGWHVLSEEEQSSFAVHFDNRRAGRNAHFTMMERFDKEPESWIELEDFDQFPATFLVKICRYAGLKLGGSKADVVLRLKAYKVLLASGEDGSADVKEEDDGSAGVEQEEDGSADVKQEEVEQEEVDAKVEDELEPTSEPRVSRKRGAAKVKKEAVVPRKKAKVGKKVKKAAVKKDSPPKEAQKLTRAERAARRAEMQAAG